MSKKGTKCPKKRDEVSRDEVSRDEGSNTRDIFPLGAFSRRGELLLKPLAF